MVEILGRPGLEMGRAARVRAGELAHLAVERGREEHRLPLLGQAPDEAVDLRLEAHVEHPVGLVEDEDPDPRSSETSRRSTRSCRRPGVAIRTWAPRARFAWLEIGAPP